MTPATGQPQDRKRFGTGDYPDLEDVADPHTLEDETHESILERAKTHWKLLAIVVPLAIIAAVVGAGYVWHLVPQLLGNFWFQLASAFAIAIGAAAYATNQWRLGWYRRQNEVVLRTPNDPLPFNCEVRQNKYGGPIVVPIKGYRWFNTVPVYYTMEEFGHELGLTWSKADFDPDDPATIQLHPKLASWTKTDLGMVFEQPTGDPAVEVDEFGRESVLYATTPEPVDRDVAEVLKTELVREREERQELQARLDDMKRRLEAAKEIGAMTPDEYLESHREFTADMMAVARGRKRPSETDDEETPAVGTSGSEYDFSEIESELSADD